jgi:hypothetical protein
MRGRVTAPCSNAWPVLGVPRGRWIPAEGSSVIFWSSWVATGAAIEDNFEVAIMKSRALAFAIAVLGGTPLFSALTDSVDPPLFGRELRKATSAAKGGFVKIKGELDLHNNTWPKSTVQLPGATNCSVDGRLGRAIYLCDFVKGASEEEMFHDFEYLVGLVRSATAIPPVPGPGRHQVRFVLPTGGYIAVGLLKRVILPLPKDKTLTEFALRLEVRPNSEVPQTQGTVASSDLGPPGEPVGQRPIPGNRGTTIGGLGAYTPLPPALPVGDPDPSSVDSWLEIQNSTAFELHLVYEGPVRRDLNILPGNSSRVDLVPGTYRVTGSVASSTVLPFFGSQQYVRGQLYKSQFYIQ